MATNYLGLGGWADPVPRRSVPFWEAVREDVAAHVEHARSAGKPRGRLGIVLGSAGFHAVLLYRIAHAARPAGPIGAVAAGILFWMTRHLYFCSLSSTARLHGGLILPHPQGIVVGPGTVVGPGGWIEQNVTFGGAPRSDGMPRVGAGVRIACGAVLVGPVTVGDSARIGPYAVIAADIPPGASVDVPGSEVRVSSRRRPDSHAALPRGN